MTPLAVAPHAARVLRALDTADAARLLDAVGHRPLTGRLGTVRVRTGDGSVYRVLIALHRDGAAVVVQVTLKATAVETAMYHAWALSLLPRTCERIEDCGRTGLCDGAVEHRACDPEDSAQAKEDAAQTEVSSKRSEFRRLTQCGGATCAMTLCRL